MEINQMSQSDKGIALKNLEQSFVLGLYNAKATAPKEFLESLGLDYKNQNLQVSFNSGQFHHRKDEAFRQPYIELGMLTETISAVPLSDPDRKVYSVFGQYGLMFALKNEQKETVSFYTCRFKLDTPKTQYLNTEGIYPAFPSVKTTRLFITQNVIDAASIIQSGLLQNRDAVIALMDGEVTKDIEKAVEQLAELEEIIVFNPKSDLQRLSKAMTKTVLIPEGDSLNQFWMKYGLDGIETLLAKPEAEEPAAPELIAVSKTEHFFKGKEVNYRILGDIPTNASYLEMQFEIWTDKDASTTYRKPLNLLDSDALRGQIYSMTEGKEINYGQMLLELEVITKDMQLLQREKRSASKPAKKTTNTTLEQRAMKILQSPNLMAELDTLVQLAGIVGEEEIRLLLFVIASSYKTSFNLHAVIQTADLNTGSELVRKITALIPEKERYPIDRASSRTFRYYDGGEINNKFLAFEDYTEIISSKAIHDLKLLQARSGLATDAPVKDDDDGLMRTKRQEVQAHTSSIGACTNTKAHFENAPKTIVVGLDTSEEQMQRLMEHDCQLMSGTYDYRKENQSKELLHCIIEKLVNKAAVNPLAANVMLPASIPNARILNSQLHHFIAVIALFHQYQRKTDDQGRVIVQKEDVEKATDLFLQAIMLQVDELDVTLREFYEDLKVHFKKAPNSEVIPSFNSLSVRKKLKMSKSNVNRNLKKLLEYEYIEKAGHKNLGFEYRLAVVDESSAVKSEILKKLSSPL